MLDDRRATRFMKDFVGQWLQMRDIGSHEPDGRLFAAFDDTLRAAMVRETELFFESQVRQDRPIPELLEADYTFLNEQLASTTAWTTSTGATSGGWPGTTTGGTGCSVTRAC